MFSLAPFVASRGTCLQPAILPGPSVTVIVANGLAPGTGAELALVVALDRA